MDVQCDLQIKVEEDEYISFDFEDEILASHIKIEDESLLEVQSTSIKAELNTSDIETESENETTAENVTVENISIKIEPNSSYNLGNDFNEHDPLAIDSCSKKIVNSWKTYPHVCFICNQWPFLGFDSLYFHIEQEHEYEYVPRGALHLRCNYCEKSIFCYSVFLNHIRFSHHSDWKLCCDICDERFEDYMQLSEHRNIHKDLQNTIHPIVYLCFKCGRAYPNEPELNNHYKLSHSHSCSVCREVYNSKSELDAHFHCLHNFKCKICDMIFVVRRHFQDHQKVHRPIILVCEYCRSTFSSPNALRVHVKGHFFPVKFKCDYCNKEFNKRVEKAAHERIHTGLEVYSCKQCSVEFATAEKLTEHESSHEPIRYLKCGLCQKGFQFLYKLKEHKRKVHNVHKDDRCCVTTTTRLKRSLWTVVPTNKIL